MHSPAMASMTPRNVRRGHAGARSRRCRRQQQQFSEGRPEYKPTTLTHQARDPPPHGEEFNLANTSGVSLSQLSRPGTSSHLIAWRPDDGGYKSVSVNKQKYVAQRCAKSVYVSQRCGKWVYWSQRRAKLVYVLLRCDKLVYVSQRWTNGSTCA